MIVNSEVLLSVRDLSVAFPVGDGDAYAVNSVSFDLPESRILGMVGESGCGKSITSLALLRLIPRPGRVVNGSICFDGQSVLELPESRMRQIRGASIALIPQDPLTSLNPVYTIGDQLCEVIQLHRKMSRKQARQRAIELLEQVQMPRAASRLDDYPHQFSGGMRQRVMIAMALSCNPKLLIADEPTTALDVTVQAQILDLMRQIRDEHQMAILLITHDLGVVAELCDDVAVMYAGRIVESGPVPAVFRNPMHPYTEGLIRSLPSPGKDRLEPVEGHPPALHAMPAGCAFEPRCEYRMPQCAEERPLLTDSNGHCVWCYRYEPSLESLIQ